MSLSRRGDWMNADTLCLISGMAGSRRGWRVERRCALPQRF
jgi:2-dehydro-3-deoxygalactonokinase